jgi:N-methylhydantoinase A
MQLSLATQESWNAACAAFRGMLEEGDQWLSSEKVAKELRSFRLAIDAHYEGQNHELRVALDDLDEGGLPLFLERFRQAHEAGYGYDIPGQAVVIVSCRLQAVGQIPKPPAPAYRGGDTVAAAVSGERPVYYGDEGWLPSKVYRRELLPVGAPVSGPAIITEMSSTTVVLKGQHATIDPFGNIIIQA